MNLSTLDIGIIIAFFAITLFIGIIAARSAGQSSKDFFLSGRNMPWWLLGVSMVATTFSADTPNLVTDIVRKHGVAGNWVWWAFLITGMATVFIYAKLWRRSGINTDLEFYEMRYSGPEATFLRGFRAVYLGVFFNVMIMASVMLAGIKISAIMLGLSAVQTVLLVSVVTVIYSSLGGLRGVILTDFFQFILSMIGMVAAAVYIIGLPEIGSISNLISHPNVAGKIDFIPDLTDWEVALPLFFIPLAVQWWSAWYPGAEPGGGGYVAQRMLSAKNEKDATKATLFFNAAHYALRPWPWILIALASLIIFPNLSDIKTAFPAIDDSILAHDLAFPAMLTLLPKGLIGLVIAALIAALMSTISTHLNWGASYMVNDVYKRFVNETAPEKDLVLVGRLATFFLMIFAAIFALFLTNAMQMFNILLQVGAGTGLLFLLRWFWWRINAYSEISAMIISLILAIYFELVYKPSFNMGVGVSEAEATFPIPDWKIMSISVAVTTVVWIFVTLITRPTSKQKLTEFYTAIRPYNLGWKPISDNLSIEDRAKITSVKQSLATEVFLMFLGCILIYSALFGTGYLLYGMYLKALIALVIVVGVILIMRGIWRSEPDSKLKLQK